MWYLVPLLFTLFLLSFICSPQHSFIHLLQSCKKSRKVNLTATQVFDSSFSTSVAALSSAIRPQQTQHSMSYRQHSLAFIIIPHHGHVFSLSVCLCAKPLSVSDSLASCVWSQSDGWAQLWVALLCFLHSLTSLTINVFIAWNVCVCAFWKEKERKKREAPCCRG